MQSEHVPWTCAAHQREEHAPHMIRARLPLDERQTALLLMSLRTVERSLCPHGPLS